MERERDRERELQLLQAREREWERDWRGEKEREKHKDLERERLRAFEREREREREMERERMRERELEREQHREAAGVTLTLAEDYETAKKREGTWQHELARDVSAALLCSASRFEYVGMQSGSILASFNLLPAALGDTDKRTALNLFHELNLQVFDASSRLRTSPTTVKVIDVTLHSPQAPLQNPLSSNGGGGVERARDMAWDAGIPPPASSVLQRWNAGRGEPALPVGGRGGASQPVRMIDERDRAFENERERVAERQQEGERERQRVMGEREHWGEAEKFREREREREREIQRLRTKEEERERVLMRERERAREKEREWEREREHISLGEQARTEERELERKREQERLREKELWERMCAADLAQKTKLPLPEGWTEGWSRTKLKPYYRHLASGSTTWSLPTAALAVGTEDGGRQGGRDRGEAELVGLGMVLQVGKAKNGGGALEVRVEKVVDGGGAALSEQVLEGDVLVSVDGTSVRGMPLTQILDLIRGRRGTSCVLQLDRKPPSSVRLPLSFRLSE
jgi:hypothetical protein